MLSHVVALLILALLTVETWRTVLRFGERRRGVGSQLVSKPFPHFMMAALYVAVGVGLYPVAWWPRYFSVGMVALALVYLGFTLRWAMRRESGS